MTLPELVNRIVRKCHGCTFVELTADDYAVATFRWGSWTLTAFSCPSSKTVLVVEPQLADDRLLYVTNESEITPAAKWVQALLNNLTRNEDGTHESQTLQRV